jgi:hypothetical protein
MKGICFIEPLFDATIQEIKKQTRRIVRAPKNSVGIQIQTRAMDGAFWGCFALNEDEGTTNPKTDQEWVINPRYKGGEIIYLKEPYYLLPDFIDKDVIYKFGYTDEMLNNPALWKNNFIPKANKIKWKNKLFMPASAARYFIQIADVQCERLQDISDEDCIKEGISEEFPEAYGLDNSYKRYFRCPDEISMEWFKTPQEAYAYLINKINGAGTWESNPFVWVYTYKLINRH